MLHEIKLFIYQSYCYSCNEIGVYWNTNKIRFTLTWSRSKGPVFIIIKMGISLYSLTWRVGVSQQPIFPIKRVGISVIWNKNSSSFKPPQKSKCLILILLSITKTQLTFFPKGDHDVSSAVKEARERQRGNVTPDFESSGKGVIDQRGFHVWWIVQNPASQNNAIDYIMFITNIWDKSVVVEGLVQIISHLYVTSLWSHFRSPSKVW